MRPLQLARPDRARRSRILLHLLLASAVALVTSPAAVRAQSLVPGIPSPNGAVYVLESIGNTAFVGGAFDRLGIYCGGGAAIDGTTGKIRPGSPGFRVGGASSSYPGGLVTVAIPDGSGGWFVGGDFLSLGGVSRPSLAHVDANGALLSWTPPAPNGSVWSLLLSGTTLYVGGDFTTFGATTRNHIAALDAATGAVLGWDPGADGRVQALALSGSTLYAGGDFNTLGGQPRVDLGAVDTGTGAATSWAPAIVGAWVTTIALDSGVAYLGGIFTSVQGQNRANAAAVNLATAAVTSWSPNASGEVRSLIPSGGSVYAGGEFTTIGNRSRTGVAQLNTTNGNASAGWNAGCDDYVYKLALSGSTLYVGGTFTVLGGQPRSRVGAIGLTTPVATAWAPSVDGNVWTVCPSGGGVWLGGPFQRADLVIRRGLAAIDLTTRTVTSWNPDLDGTVYALATDGTTLYAGGTFSQAGGAARKALAAYVLPSSTPSAFDAQLNQGSAVIPVVYALALESGVLRIGGVIDHLGATPRNNAGAVDATTGAATAWAPEPNTIVRAILPSAVGVYLAGAFHTVQGVTRDFLAQVDRSSGAPTSWVPPLIVGGFKFGGVLVSANLFSLAEKAGVLYVGGSFSSVASQTRVNFAALDPNGALLPWSVPGSYTADANIGALSLDSEGGSILAANTAPFSSGFHVLDPSSGAGAGWPPVILGAQAVGRAGGYVLVGGSFLDAGSQPSPNLAVFIDPAALDVPEGPRSQASVSLAQPMPNPARMATTLRWTLAHRTGFSLTLLDLAGRRVRALVDRAELPAGPHARTLDVASLAPGLYLLSAEADGVRATRKLLIAR